MKTSIMRSRRHVIAGSHTPYLFSLSASSGIFLPTADVALLGPAFEGVPMYWSPCGDPVGRGTVPPGEGAVAQYTAGPCEAGAAGNAELPPCGTAPGGVDPYFLAGAASGPVFVPRSTVAGGVSNMNDSVSSDVPDDSICDCPMLKDESVVIELSPNVFDSVRCMPAGFEGVLSTFRCIRRCSELMAVMAMAMRLCPLGRVACAQCAAQPEQNGRVFTLFERRVSVRHLCCNPYAPHHHVN